MKFLQENPNPKFDHEKHEIEFICSMVLIIIAVILILTLI